jgi:hypothetical protein
MKNGILRDNEGFDILVNGVQHTFRDVEKVAYGTARFLKGQRRHQGQVIEVRNRATGERRVMLNDGRLGYGPRCRTSDHTKKLSPPHARPPV